VEAVVDDDDGASLATDDLEWSATFDAFDKSCKDADWEVSRPEVSPFSFVDEVGDPVTTLEVVFEGVAGGVSSERAIECS